MTDSPFFTDSDAQYLKNCFFLSVDMGVTSINTSSAVLSFRYAIIDDLVPEIIGFTVYTLIFGELTCVTILFYFHLSDSLIAPSLIISLMCLYCLFKNRKGAPHHDLTVTSFSIVISSFNLAIFVIKSVTIITHARLSTCPSIPLGEENAFEIGGTSFYNSYANTQISAIISYAFIPIFLWISDAFLV